MLDCHPSHYIPTLILRKKQQISFLGTWRGSSKLIDCIYEFCVEVFRLKKKTKHAITNQYHFVYFFFSGKTGFHVTVRMWIITINITGISKQQNNIHHYGLIQLLLPRSFRISSTILKVEATRCIL